MNQLHLSYLLAFQDTWSLDAVAVIPLTASVCLNGHIPDMPV
jgi:hypothetical protein